MTDLAKSLGPILVTGASGQVGGELVRLLRPLGEIHAPARDELDLARPESIRETMRRLHPAWVVNAAAYTAVDRAESEPEAAYVINGEALGVLGDEAAHLGTAVLHFSTDYVFGGTHPEPYTEDAPVGPISVYGASKLAGEKALAASGAAHIILRTSWVYGAAGKNFLLTILRAARERSQLTIVDDQTGSPTWACDLARLVATILVQAPDAEAALGFQGIYHASAAGETTWFGFARRALDLLQLIEPEWKLAELLPVPTSSYPTAARRPANSRLNCGRLLKTFGFEFPAWEQGVADVLKEWQELRNEASPSAV